MGVFHGELFSISSARDCGQLRHLPSGCAVRVTMKDGRIERVAPDPGRPNGVCCRRVGRAAEILYSPDRLLHPMARVGERGENRFRNIGWDEALGHRR